MVKIKNCKIGIFSDIHWGKSRDNVKKIENNMIFIDWFITEMKSHKIKEIFFLGDWFDHRNSVNVNTGFKAYEAVKKLCKNFKVFMILGNHDTYYKNSIEVNSIKQYESLNNLYIIDKDTVIDICGKQLLCTPWGFNLHSYKNQEYDIMFGHFEPGGAILNQSGIFSRTEQYTMDDLNKIAPLVISGHYHTRKEYETRNGTFVSVGCPLELSWNDYQNTKGYYILDVNNGFEFIENKLSPKHIKFFWSKLKRKQEKLLPELIKNNYIKLIVDDKYRYEDIMRIMEAIQRHNPLSAEPDFIFSINKDLLEDVDLESNTKLKYTKLEYIIKYISKIKPDEINIEGINKDNLTEKAIGYYNKVNE